jgi:hypothetical protein
MTSRFQEPRDSGLLRVFGTYIEENVLFVEPCDHPRILTSDEVDANTYTIEYDLNQQIGENVSISGVRVCQWSDKHRCLFTLNCGDEFKAKILKALTDDTARWADACRWLESEGESVYRSRAA